jgi:hypothetical protein
LRPEATTKRRGSRGCLLRLSDLLRHGWSTRSRRMGSPTTPARRSGGPEQRRCSPLGRAEARSGRHPTVALLEQERSPPSSPRPRASPPSLSQALRSRGQRGETPTGNDDRPGRELPSLFDQQSSSSPRTGVLFARDQSTPLLARSSPSTLRSCSGRTRWRRAAAFVSTEAVAATGPPGRSIEIEKKEWVTLRRASHAAPRRAE